MYNCLFPAAITSRQAKRKQFPNILYSSYCHLVSTSVSLPSLFPPVQKGFVIGGDDEELHFAFEGEEEEEIGLPDIVVSEVPSRVRSSSLTVDSTM